MKVDAADDPAAHAWARPDDRQRL